MARGQSLAAVEVCLERRTQLLSTLTLVVKTTATLTGGGFSTEGSSTVRLVSVFATENTELLVSDDCWMVCIDENDFVELVLSVLADPVRV